MSSPNRIAIIGASGSGKSTLGQWIERRLGLPCTDLDDLFWRPGWQKAPVDLFRADVDRLTSRPLWVLAGNYGSAQDLIWPRADTLIWLDLPLPLTLWRATLRVVRQTISRQPICNGNQQSISALFFGKDPLLWYAIRTVPQRRRAWPAILARPEHKHLQVVRLERPAAVMRWQASVPTRQRFDHVV